jgi:hypothetical protein
MKYSMSVDIANIINSSDIELNTETTFSERLMYDWKHNLLACSISITNQRLCDPLTVYLALYPNFIDEVMTYNLTINDHLYVDYMTSNPDNTKNLYEYYHSEDEFNPIHYVTKLNNSDVIKNRIVEIVDLYLQIE